MAGGKAAASILSAAGKSRPVWQGWSAERTLTRRQQVVFGLLGLTLVAGCVIDLLTTLIVVAGAFTLTFAVTTVVRLFYVYEGFRRPQRPAAELPQPRRLPSYSVLVAIYGEANVVGELLDALDRLEYPREKLQLMLLVEHDDPETRAACERHLRPGWEIVDVGPGVPRTKPRALNVGLERATGELLTVFDAEDRPDPDQLELAARTFERLPGTVAALQARLDLYNTHQSSLTRWFTCEYATHFGLALVGIASLGHPMPLGGTSTHFRTRVVRELGGWDAWNVTEDCELGMRMAAAGFHAATLDSSTGEEAAASFRAWSRQRSRWVKGFAQTGLVLLRAPIRTARAMGVRRYLASLAIVPGVPVTLCAQLPFWILTLTYAVLRISGANVDPIEAVFPEPLLTAALLTLVLGNFAVLLGLVAAVYQRERWDLVRWAVAVPVYWVALSLAAWKGVGQLWRRPHYWEKTAHGLTVGDDELAAALAATPAAGEDDLAATEEAGITDGASAGGGAPVKR